MSNVDYTNAIAIVGMSGVFPKANNVDEFWQNLKQARHCISFYSQDELKTADHNQNLSKLVAAGGYTQKVRQFDAAFFGYSAKEAEIMDPQQRVFLELAWGAIENAGYDVTSIGFPVGVFAGAGMNWYLLDNLMSDIDNLQSFGVLQSLSNNRTDFLPMRVSYTMGLKGPSVNVNTACSASLVAVHSACQSLLNYECDMALAGGVSLLLNKYAYLYQSDGVFSDDGYCRAFDAAANGVVPGSGGGVVVLKRLQEAIDDKDDIDAVILGSAINNDGGRKVSFFAPSVEGQREVIAEALEIAGVKADSIGYVEAHGTGTRLGDAIEISALKQVFGTGKGSNACALGSVKTNIGHLDSAAGVAGLIKSALCLKHAKLVPSLNFNEPNPELKLEQSPFYINTEVKDWQRGDCPRRASVSSFGVGGTNAHVVLEEPSSGVVETPEEARQIVLSLSAKTPQSLVKMEKNLAIFLKKNEMVNLQDVAYTLARGRAEFHCRSAFVGDNTETLLAKLNASTSEHRQGIKQQSDKLVYMFSGVGEHYVGMASDLYAHEPVFKNTIDDCCKKIKQFSDIDIASFFCTKSENSPSDTSTSFRAMLRGRTSDDQGSSALNKTRVLHPLIFSIEYSIASLLRSWSIEPSYMIGYSLGEYVAACCSGVLSFDDAIKAVVKRAEIIEGVDSGGMLAISLPLKDILPIIDEDISIAAINGPSYTVIAGKNDRLGEIEQIFKSQSIVTVKLETEHAFHSHMMDFVKPQLLQLFSSLTFNTPSIPYVSNVTGTWVNESQIKDPNYWVEHACSTVQFDKGIDTLTDEGDFHYMEIGPGKALSSLILLKCEGKAGALGGVVSSLKTKYETIDDSQYFREQLASLWCNGFALDIMSLQNCDNGRRIKLPTYAFSETEYWVEPKVTASSSMASRNEKPREDNLNTENTDIDDSDDSLEKLTDIEQVMADLWVQLLGTKSLRPHDHFFELGGSSMLAIQLISKVEDVFEIKLQLTEIFKTPGFRPLSSLVERLIIEQESPVNTGEMEDYTAQDKQVNSRAYQYNLADNLTVLQYNSVETEHFYKDIFENKVYYKNGIKIEDGDTIFDVGSNIGLFSIFASRQASNLNIYAFEPALPMFQCLTKNTENLVNRPKLFNIGLSNYDALEEFTFYPNSTGMSSFYPDLEEEKAVLFAIMKNESRNGSREACQLLASENTFLDARFDRETVKCKLRPISDIIREENVKKIDLIKIDVQKAELDVLLGLSDRDWSIVKQIVVEVHDIDGRVGKIRSLLEGKGFRVMVEQDDLYEESVIYNLYALRAS